MATETSRNRCPVTDINVLPENCIANFLSLTSPPETCRLSLVASTFRSAAESDSVWERFLPSDYQDMIARASEPPVFASKKELYLSLSDHPLIIDDGTKSFSLDRRSGKKCFMLSARYLTIIWGDTPEYWRWISLPNESRFTEVAELLHVCWLEIHGKISTQMLSPDTTYAAYLVFKWAARVIGFRFEYKPAESWVRLSGSEGQSRSFHLDTNGRQRRERCVVPRRRVCHRNIIRRRQEVDALRESGQYPKERGDGWLEMELGEYLNKSGEVGELEICLQEVKDGNWKSGLILQGIEIKPKISTPVQNRWVISEGRQLEKWPHKYPTIKVFNYFGIDK
ncbi:F-box protein PP2-B11-like [Cornus florida]|uniref:F-box protein PP2-B11-like n=1 Tax=Cornus florida TaxID=4283 RepID=UPI0028981A20|nr:F-box protein PP2-B11-like [Cornus florida]